MRRRLWSFPEWARFVVPLEGCGTDRFLIATTTYGLYRENPGEISVRGIGGEITVEPLGDLETLAKQQLIPSPLWG